MNKILKVNAVLAFIIVITACNFFTTSWGAGLKRDNVAGLSKLSVDDLALLLSDPEYLSDPESSGDLLGALGTKTTEEIQGLSQKDKESILDHTVAAGVPISVIAQIIEQGEDVDLGSALSQLVSNSGDIDVTAAAAVLTDTETLKEADPTVIAAAALTIFIQVAADETEGSENPEQAANEFLDMITETITDSTPESSAEDIVDQMIHDGSISEESKEDMIAIITAMQVLSGTSSTGIDRSGDFDEGFDFGSLLS